MSSPIVSIIVPVYNSEKYLRQCVESILTQTFNDFELLLIDDGSTDNSGKICDEFAEKDFRITAFHTPNGGVSAARNFGIEKAKGKFINFIDSDDWIKETYLEHLLEGDENTELRVVGYLEQSSKLSWKEYLPQKETFVNEQIISFIEKHIASCIGHAPWGKLFLKEIIDKNNLYFDTKFAYGEDTFFCIRYLKKISSIKVNNSADYYWRFVGTSLSRINYIRDIEAWNNFVSVYKSEFLPIIEKSGTSEILVQHLADRYFNIFSKTVESICNAKINSTQKRKMLLSACEKLDEFDCDYSQTAQNYGIQGKLLLAMYKSRKVGIYYSIFKSYYILKNLLK